jgi:hypothetical protein
MIACPQCGVSNEDSRRQCFRCQAELPEPGPPPPPGYGAARPSVGPGTFPAGGMVPAPDDPYAPVRYTAPSREDVDEQFLDQFSWAPGCWLYYLSRAMWLFLIGTVAVRIYDAVLGAWSLTVKRGDLGGGLLAILLGLADLVAVFGLMVWAGKVGRRRRWEQLNWRDFEEFRRDETARQTLGIVCWALQIVLLIVSFCNGLAMHH